MVPAVDGVKSRSELIRQLVIEGLTGLVRRQQRWGQQFAKAQSGPFTAEREKGYTAMIKYRALYEGACNLEWKAYFAWRDKHKNCEPLTAADERYADAYSSCPVPKAKP